VPVDWIGRRAADGLAVETRSLRAAVVPWLVPVLASALLVWLYRFRKGRII